MSKLLFTHSYFLKLDPKQWKLGQPYAPLGTLYAAGYMRELGHKVDLHDVMFSTDPSEIEPAIDRSRADIVVMYDDGFNYLTKMCLTNMRHAAFEMIRIAKKKGCIVIVSSSDSTDRFEEYLSAGADYVLLGEAEYTLAELVQELELPGSGVDKITGLAFQRDHNIIKTPRRPVIKDLDALPLPAWDLVDLGKYKAVWMQHAGYFSVNIGTTRGCPFKCNWCAKPIYGNRYNARSPQKIVDEIACIESLIEFDHIWFCDDIFGLKPGWISEFANLVHAKGKQVPFKIQSRADLLVQETYVASLARAGCDTVWMGAESGSQKILDAMDKGISIAQISEATELLKQHKIKPCFFIQFGYPGETKSDIELTIRMIKKLMPAEIGISVSYPLPGTSFYEKVKNELREKTNWTDSDELALMFRNTYQPSFYKRLHRYVHRSYRAQQAIQTFKAICHHPSSLSFSKLKRALSFFYYMPAGMFSRYLLQQYER